MIPSGSQTVGPFFNFALSADLSLGVMAREGATGERIRIVFHLFDGDGIPAPGDAMIELWQADAEGRYVDADPNFRGFGRLETDVEGTCGFETIMPGSVANAAPHINVTIFARGLLKQLHTRLYFALDPTDAVLALVPQARRATLLARKQEDAWHMDIRLQGEGETVFFDL